MQYIEKSLPWLILAAIFLTLYYSRATYEATVPGVKPMLNKPAEQAK